MSIYDYILENKNTIFAISTFLTLVLLGLVIYIYIEKKDCNCPPGEKGQQGSQGVPGPQGPQGPQGPPIDLSNYVGDVNIKGNIITSGTINYGDCQLVCQTPSPTSPYITPNPTIPSTSSSGGLGGGYIAIIVISLLLVFGGAGYYFYKREESKTETKKEDIELGNLPGRGSYIPIYDNRPNLDSSSSIPGRGFSTPGVNIPFISSLAERGVSNPDIYGDSDL